MDKQNITNIYKKDRNEAIWLARKQGKTLQSIGNEYGITKERVRVICLKEERIRRRRGDLND